MDLIERARAYADVARWRERQRDASWPDFAAFVADYRSVWPDCKAVWKRSADPNVRLGVAVTVIPPKNPSR
jgi:hypothetical protein